MAPTGRLCISCAENQGSRAAIHSDGGKHCEKQLEWLKSSSLCVLSTYMQVRVHECAHPYQHVWKPVVDIGTSLSIPLHLFFFFLSLKLAVSTRLSGQQAACVCPSLPACTGVTNTCRHVWFFTWMLGLWTWVLVCKTFTSPAISFTHTFDLELIWASFIYPLLLLETFCAPPPHTSYVALHRVSAHSLRSQPLNNDVLATVFFFFFLFKKICLLHISTL